MSAHKSSAASRQRQTAFELERHAFEGNTLTQLFLILSKHRASWWKDQENASSQQNNTTSTAPTTFGQDANATVSHALDGSVLGSPGKRSLFNPEASANATLRSHSVAPSPMSKRDDAPDRKELIKRRRALAKAEQQQRKAISGGTPSASAAVLQIPDTVVWENNIPKGWFYFDAKECHVARRKVETRQIQEAFLRDALFENDIVAVVYSVPHHQQHDADEDGTESLQYRYLTAAELPMFLFENRRGKGTSVLQKFVYPLNIQHNDCIQVVWSPLVSQVNRRQNIHDIFDERVPPSDRCATFEGRTHLSRNVQCTPRLEQRIHEMCVELVKHFRETDSKYVVSRLVLHTKITDASELVILYCSSARVLPASIAAPLTLPSGATVNVTAESVHAGGSNGGVSQLQRKYRVSLEMATRYTIKQIEDPQVTSQAGGGGPGSKQRRGSVRGGNLAASVDAALSTLPNSRASMAASVVGDVGTASPVPDLPQVTVDGRSAVHHGFIVRAESPQSNKHGSPRRRSESASPGGGKGSPDGGRRDERGRLNSMRSSSAERLSLVGVVQDVMRVEEKDFASDAQKHKARHLMQAALKKVGPVAMRTALLQTRPNAQLTEFEKMELLYLKMSELERRRSRRGSAVLSSASPSPSPLRAVRMEPSPMRSIPTASVKNVVFDGALRNVIDATVEERWLEIAYAAQTHFDTVAVGANNQCKFECELDGTFAGRPDAAIARWLFSRKALTDTIGSIGRGVYQTEGATLRFELTPIAGAAQPPNDMPWRSMVVLGIPVQIRAAQKLFHEAHDAMCSASFAAMVSEEAALASAAQQFDASGKNGGGGTLPAAACVESDGVDDGAASAAVEQRTLSYSDSFPDEGEGSNSATCGFTELAGTTNYQEEDAGDGA